MLNQAEVCLRVVAADGVRTIWYNVAGEILAFRYAPPLFAN
jgi:hypothetical protein